MPPARTPPAAFPIRPSRLEPILTGLCLALIAGLFALWLPNYLRWPLFLDAEHFALLAREWDAGVARPYRDSFCYNLPGHIYLFWAGGKLFGWGKPLAVLLPDVILLVSFCGWTLAWSRRCFGKLLPGALALLGLLSFYFNSDFRFTAERTWHSALLAASAIMVCQAVPGLRGGAFSGLLMGLALLVRPDIAVWGSGALVILVTRAFRSGSERPFRQATRSVLSWSFAAGLVLALGMVPLLAGGLLPDFLRSFRVALAGGVYDADVARTHTTWGILGNVPYYDCLKPYHFAFFLLGMPGLWAAALWRGRNDVRANLGVWVWCSVAFAVVALNVPFYIGYLIQPVFFAAFLSLAPTIAALSDDLRRGPGLGLAVAVLLGLFLVPGLPTYCVPKLARETYSAVLSGRRVEAAPSFFPYAIAEDQRQRQWADFGRCVTYLRHELPRGHAVMNAIDPFGDFGGLGMVYASKRRMGGGSNELILPSLPDPIFERFLNASEREPRAAVLIDAAQVATHGEGAVLPPEKLNRWKTRIVRMIHDHYQLKARFGEIEVWVRTPGTGPEPMQISAKPGAVNR